MERNRKITCERFELEFRHDGKIASTGTGGFCLETPDGMVVTPNDTYVEDGRLIVPFGVGDYTRVEFQTDARRDYIGLELVAVKNLPKMRMRLVLEMTEEGIECLPHRYTVVRKGNRLIWDGLDTGEWGGFSLLKPTDEADRDETLYAVWGEQKITHPKTPDGKWDEKRARAWLDAIDEEFPGSMFLTTYASTMGVEAGSWDELMYCTDFAIRHHAAGIYLMPWIWRDGFWPVALSEDEVNTRIFPEGRKSLLAYAAYLRSHGLKLILHNVCGGIGFRDKNYVLNGIDERLASWGAGRLEQSVSADDTTLLFRPDPGTVLPLNLASYTGSMDARMADQPFLYSFFGFHIIAVDNELIRVGRFETDGEVWRLTDCIRSYGTDFSDGFSPRDKDLSTAASHAAGARVRGLVDTYGVNLIPDPKSDMLPEMARRFADGILNEPQSCCAVFDGMEIHSALCRFGQEEFPDLVYSMTDHPVAVITSMARPPRAYFEHNFARVRNKVSGLGFGYAADLRLDRPSWTASTLVSVNFTASNNVANGCDVNSVRDHHTGVTREMIDRHGLAEATMELLEDWRRVSMRLTPEQRESLRRTEYPHHPLIDSGNHPYSPYVQTLTKTDAEYIITPKAVNGLVSDDPYAQKMWTRFGQEQGVVEMRTYFRTGERVRLRNICAEQEPTFMCRVMSRMKNDDPKNIPLLKPGTELINDTDTRVGFVDGVLTLDGVNNGDKPRYEQKRLIRWKPAQSGQRGLVWDGITMRETGGILDMSHARGVGMTVVGDGSGAVLVFSIAGRDYPVRVDFVGERLIQIPNGEYGWSYPSWGWSMLTWKFIDYAAVPELRISLGRIDPHTAPHIVVKDLVALHETPATLKDPVFTLNGGTLRVLGTVCTDEQIAFEGGDQVGVYDLNWNLLRTLPVEKKDFRQTAGEGELTVTAAEGGEGVWLEYAQFTSDTDHIIRLPR